MKSSAKYPIMFATILLTTFLLLSMTAPLLGVEASAGNRTLVVPDNYPTISAALTYAAEGDIVFVKKGVYNENPLVDKAITLRGEKPNGTVVVGTGGVERGAKAAFTLAADGIILTGFTIQSQFYSNSTYYASGVNIQGDNCILSDNTINGTYYGIFSSVQSQTSIVNNSITGTLKEGIRICGGSENTISGNHLTGNAQSGIAIDGYSDTIIGNNIAKNTRGIGLGAAYSLVFGNNLTENSESGIFLASSDSLIVQNNIQQNKWGIYITTYFAAPNNNKLYQNNFVSNAHPVGTGSTLNSQTWDNDKEGNFWDGYQGQDGNNDGIGDSPFIPYGADADKFPLTSYVVIHSSTALALPVPQTVAEGTVSIWHFDEAGSNGATPDSLGNNPVVLEPTGDVFTPVFVEGQQGKALQFNGSDYAYVTSSPTLDIKGEVTVDAWIKVPQFKEVTYNNIFVECKRTPDKYPIRILGFAINGEPPQNSTSPPLGALRGFFLDDGNVFNEIVTTEAAVPLNEWIHVVFIRSLTDGMHIYVNGLERSVQVISGRQNPAGAVAKGTEFYIGHDSYGAIDELMVSNAAKKPAQQTHALWSEWWFPATIAFGILLLSGIVLLTRRNRRNTAP